MNANFKQLEAIERIKSNFNGLIVDHYGHYSNGSLGVSCEDKFGIFSITVDLNGLIR
jgi:hypothetical protein